MLRRRWARWTAIVELYARRRPARRRVDPAAYQALHRDLIAACRMLAESADEDRRAYYRELEGTIAPWLSPRTLAQADGEILAGLMVRCHEVAGELGARNPAPHLVVVVVKFSLLIGLFAGCLALMQAAGVDLALALARMRGVSDAVWLGVTRSSDMQRLGAAVALVVLVSHRLLSRTSRS